MVTAWSIGVASVSGGVTAFGTAHGPRSMLFWLVHAVLGQPPWLGLVGVGA